MILGSRCICEGFRMLWGRMNILAGLSLVLWCLGYGGRDEGEGIV